MLKGQANGSEKDRQIAAEAFFCLSFKAFLIDAFFFCGNDRLSDAAGPSPHRIGRANFGFDAEKVENDLQC